MIINFEFSEIRKILVQMTLQKQLLLVTCMYTHEYNKQNAGVCVHLLCLQHCSIQCRFYGWCTFVFFTAVRPSVSKPQLSKPNIDFEMLRTRDMFVRFFSTGNFLYWQPAGSRVWIVRYNQCLKSTNIPDLPATNTFLLLRALSACYMVLKCNTCNALRHKTRIAIAVRWLQWSFWK